MSPRSFLRFMTGLPALALLAGCGGGSGTTPTPPPPPPATVASVTVSPGTLSLVVGVSASLTATALSATGTPISGKVATWTTSDAAVATVAADGVVSGVGAGNATVTAAIDGKSGSAAVSVIMPLAASVTVSPPAVTIGLNEAATLTATARDGNNAPIPGKPFTWSSSTPSVATVSQAGVVTGLTEGDAQVTATADAASGSATVTVRIAVASVAVTPATAALLVGATAQLTATPQSASGAALPGRPVTWLTSNAAVATVSASGLVTARAAGVAIITASSEGKTGAATVTVTAVPVASVDVAPPAPSIQTGGSVQLVATPMDSAGHVLTGRTITWSSANSGVATVSTSGRVTGVTPGQAVITATSEGKSGTATVTVLNSPVASVTVQPATASIGIGGTLQMSAVLRSAAGDTLTGRTVTWSSKVPGVATVTPSGGLLTAVSAGITTITALSEGKSGTAEINVTLEPPATVTVLPATSTVTAGDVLTLTAVSRDAGGSVLPGRTAAWATYYGFAVTSYSSNDTVVVTGIAAGTDTVVAMVGGTSGEAQVRVNASSTDICTQVAGASVIANDGTFLGLLASGANAQSIYNPYGTYGSQTSALSIYNPNGQYGGITSARSPWNPYAALPPTLVKNSVTLGFFTLNRLQAPRISPSFPEYCTFP